jgi:hypothetical protein
VICIYPSEGLVAASNSTVSPLPNRSPSLIVECSTFLPISSTSVNRVEREKLAYKNLGSSLKSPSSPPSGNDPRIVLLPCIGVLGRKDNIVDRPEEW